MRLSVVIPSRNRAQKLNTLLKSFLKQTRSANEIIVVDNASGDNSADIVRRYQKALPIKYIYEEKVGPSNARNSGIRAAGGDVLAFVDDDCVASVNWVKTILKAHKRNKEAVVQGRTIYLRETNSLSCLLAYFFLERHLRLELFSSLKQSLKTTPQKRVRVNFVDTNNLSLSKQVIIKNKLWFDEELPIYAEDTDLYLRISNLDIPIYYSPDVKVKHPINRSEISLMKKRFQAGYAHFLLKNKWKLKTKGWQKNIEWKRVRKMFISEIERQIINGLNKDISWLKKGLFALGKNYYELFWKLGYLTGSIFK